MAYRRILATPHVLALAASSVVARLPMGMTALAFVIFVHNHTGSFAAAGLVAGAGTIGLAATVLVPAAALAAAALVAAVLLGEAGAGTAPLVALAALSGAAMPPVGGLLRHL